MPSLLSGGVTRVGGSGQTITLAQAQPQLPATDTTETGFTLVTSPQLITSYRSSLGFLQFTTGTISNQIPGKNIVLAATGTATVVISGSVDSTNPSSGSLIVKGGLGVLKHAYFGEDINVNGLRIGTGFPYGTTAPNVNNIVLRGVVDSWESEYSDGESNIAIGYDTLKGLDSANKSIAIGRFALSSGTNVLRSIAIGDSALRYARGDGYGFIGTATDAQANGYTYVKDSIGFPTFYSKGYLDVPEEPEGITIITVINHGLTSGNYIFIDYRGEPGGYDYDNNYYVKVLSSSTFTIYVDQTLSTGYCFSDDIWWFSTASIYTYNLPSKGNIAIGTNAGKNAANGVQNFFLGDNAAQNFTTGSYNYFLGPDVAQNMTHGNSIIAIGSDNLVDGVDNQINIGSVFYYNGYGYLQLNADVGLGLGYVATSTQTAALAVLGGVGISENIIVGSTTESTATSNGAMVVYGGAGIAESVHIGGGLVVNTGNKDILLSPVAADVRLEPTLGGSVSIFPNAQGAMNNVAIGQTVASAANFSLARVLSTLTSTSTTTGALTVTGGVGVGGTMTVGGLITGRITTATNIYGGLRGSIPYQTTANITTLLPIGADSDILVSNGSTPYWTNVNSLLSNTTTNAAQVFMNTATSGTYYITLAETQYGYTRFDSTSTLTYDQTIGSFNIGNTTSATSTTTGALTVTGGLGVQGSIYSADGSPGENYLMYVPRVIISATAPEDARIGEFWIDPTTGYELQYIQDGDQKIWIQFTGL